MRESINKPKAIHNMLPNPNTHFSKDLLVKDPFKQKLLKVIRENLSDTSFGVEALAKEMFMCRSTLHRKVKKQYQMTASEIINQERIKRSIVLLNTDLNLLEIACEVGFSSHSYFNKFFKKNRMTTPKKFRNKT